MSTYRCRDKGHRALREQNATLAIITMWASVSTYIFSPPCLANQSVASITPLAVRFHFVPTRVCHLTDLSRATRMLEETKKRHTLAWCVGRFEENAVRRRASQHSLAAATAEWR